LCKEKLFNDSALHALASSENSFHPECKLAHIFIYFVISIFNLFQSICTFTLETAAYNDFQPILGTGPIESAALVLWSFSCTC